MTLIYGQDELISKWVSLQLFNDYDSFDEKTRAIGVILNNKIIAGVTYTNYIPELSIEMSVAGVDKRWCNRHNLKAFFAYPFIDLRVKRVSTLCSAQKEGVIMFNKRLGFTQEGYHRAAWSLGGDAISWGMLESECKWIK